MKYLLDTHTFLWMAADPERLSPKVRGIMLEGKNKLYLSAASGWEVALLTALKRIELPDTPLRFVPEALKRFDILPLPISFSTAMAAALLPMIHRDPFDRILIAEAEKEKMCILTKDAKISQYGAQTLW